MYGIYTNLEALERAIQLVGGSAVLSRLTGITYQSIYNWQKGKVDIHPLNCIKIEKATNGKVKRQDLLPTYPWETITFAKKEFNT